MEVSSVAQLNQAFPSVGQSVPPIAHGQAAYPSHIQGPTIPGSFQRPDVPQESAIPPADQGLTRDGQTIPTSRWIAATQSYARAQPGAENQIASAFDEHQLGYQTPNVRPTERALRELTSPRRQLSSQAVSTATIKTFHMIVFWDDLQVGRSHTKITRTSRSSTPRLPTMKNGRRASSITCQGRTGVGQSYLTSSRSSPTITTIKCSRRCTLAECVVGT